MNKSNHRFCMPYQFVVFPSLLSILDRSIEFILHSPLNMNQPILSNELPALPKELKKKKSYGNRTNQRFRKRRRARGMNPKQIERLLEKRNAINNQRPTTATAMPPTRTFDKRKRDRSVANFQSLPTTMSKSVSSISIHQQPTVKKMKKQTIRTTTSTDTDDLYGKIYRFDVILTVSSNSPLIIVGNRCI